MKRWLVIIALGVGMVAGLGYALDYFGVAGEKLTIGGRTYDVLLAKTPAELERGLSGTKELGRDQAMLFVFPESKEWSIWMKDMNYSIDIVWVDTGNRVVHLVENAQPSSYPTQKFRPDKPAKYVIELNSGMIKEAGIKVNDHVGIPRGARI